MTDTLRTMGPGRKRTDEPRTHVQVIGTRLETDDNGLALTLTVVRYPRGVWARGELPFVEDIPRDFREELVKWLDPDQEVDNLDDLSAAERQAVLEGPIPPEPRER